MLNFETKSKLKSKVQEIDMALSNNYKDNAHLALKELYELLGQLKEDGKIKEKDYDKWRVKADSYATRMKGYGHNNHIGW